MSGLRVARYKGKFAVFDGGNRLSGELEFEIAEDRAAQILTERTRPKRRRPCITCGTPILSEGPHHRMCTGCRHASDPLGAAQHIPNGREARS